MFSKKEILANIEKTKAPVDIFFEKNQITIDTNNEMKSKNIVIFKSIVELPKNNIHFLVILANFFARTISVNNYCIF